MIFLFTAIFFILGLIIGSFLNVVIYRFNTNRSLGGRSACMSCGRRLPWYELIPLFSFLSLRGRCSGCKTKISVQYFLVEFIAGLIFVLLFLKFSIMSKQDFFFWLDPAFLIAYVYYAVLFSILVVIAVYDLKHKIIPDTLSFAFGALAFLGLFFFSGNNLSGLPVFYLHMPSILEFLSGFFIALPFAFFWLVSGGKWMGLGDAKLALGIGWLLGFSSALSALAVAFWLGAIIGVCLVVFSKIYRTGSMRMKSEIPFAPFLVFGALFTFLLGLNLFIF